MLLERRPAVDTDLSAARRVHHRSFRDVVERQFGTWDEALQDGFFDAEWERQPHEIVVVDGELAGYIAVDDFDDHTFVHNVVLDPDVQGRGIGTALLTEVIDAARARGVPVRLQVLHANRAAHLYRRLGFVEIGRTPTNLVLERAPG